MKKDAWTWTPTTTAASMSPRREWPTRPPDRWGVVDIYRRECHSFWRRKDLVLYAPTRMSLVDIVLNEK